MNKSYLAGFFDGDGSVYICQTSLTVTFTNCHLPFLKEVLSNFPEGNIYTDDRKNRNNCRICYNLKITGHNTLNILEFLKDSVIVKKEQINLAIEYITNQSLNPGVRKEYKKKLQDLKKNTQNATDFDRINKEYVAGLLDAEGCISYYKSPCIRIVQKSCPKLLEEIIKFYNYGTTRECYRLFFEQKEWCKEFLQSILHLLIIKKEEAETFIKIVDLPSGEEKEGLKQKLKDLKHINYEYNDKPVRQPEIFDYKKDTPVLNKTLQILSGFIDNCMCINVTNQNFLNVTLTSKNRGMLNYIHNLYPEARKVEKENYDILRFNGKKSHKLLGDIYPFVIIKKERIKEILNLEEAAYPFNYLYFAGMLEASCSLDIKRNTYVFQINNKYSPILGEIQAFFGNQGLLKETHILFDKKDQIKEILSSVSVFSKSKKRLFELFIKYTASPSDEVLSNFKDEMKISIDTLPSFEEESDDNLGEDIKKMSRELCLENDKQKIFDENKKVQLHGVKLKRPIEFYEKLKYISKDIPRDISIEFVENKDQLDKFNVFKSTTSSFPTGKKIGRSVKILIQSEGKNIGVIELTSAISSYFSFKKLSLKEINDYLEIACCVPLQPFGYNFNGGKLLVALCYSKEVVEYCEKKYNFKLKGFITTSINGKSIMYDRLPFLKLKGFTEGMGFNKSYIPSKLFSKIKQYYKDNFDVSSKNNVEMIIRVFKHLDLDPMLLHHGQKRGIYFGEIGELKTISERLEWWINRWAIKRIENLKNKN